MNRIFASFSLYRRTVVLGGCLAVACFVLTVAAANGPVLPALVWAQESGEWPDQIDYPPQAFPQGDEKNADREKPAKTNEAGDKAGRKWWPFSKAKGVKAQPMTEEQITRVGPKEPPPSPNPLLRLSVSFYGENGMVPSGFYLVGVKEVSSDVKELTLFRQNRPVYRLQVQQTADEAEPSPVGPIKEPLKPSQKLEIQLSGDQKSIRLILTEGTARFESQPLPTASDIRH